MVPLGSEPKPPAPRLLDAPHFGASSPQELSSGSQSFQTLPRWTRVGTSKYPFVSLPIVLLHEVKVVMNSYFAKKIRRVRIQIPTQYGVEINKNKAVGKAAIHCFPNEFTIFHLTAHILVE
jgi:hypothetical protein